MPVITSRRVDPTDRQHIVYVLSAAGEFMPSYVGITYQGLYTRLWGHKNDVKRGSQLPVHRWMRKVGIDNVTIHLYETHESRVESYDAEKSWIDALRSVGFTLYNLTDGGPGISGVKRTDETRERISSALQGHVVSAETKAKLSSKMSGTKLSEEAKARFRQSAPHGDDHWRHAMHVRWHTNRGIVKEGCVHCAN